MWLGSRGLDVLGVDINADAILQARALAEILNVRVRFLEGDFLDHPDLGRFDLVVMVRVLTCFSLLSDWRALLTRSLACVAPGGLIYVHDFLFTPENEIYRKRYEEGARQGWRSGNFAVPAKNGGTLFIAHHHSTEELEEIMGPYEKILLNPHDSLSLNGNACRM
ncbi:MAG TPA: class I SAM-dependent methyltransferase, partial [Terracidiphilus sp.]